MQWMVVCVFASGGAACNTSLPLDTPDLTVPVGFGPSCSNGIQDGNETDVDCGGQTCPACVGEKMCAHATDCQSGVCTNNICGAGIAVEDMEGPPDMAMLMCSTGTANCDGNAANGCETNTATDAKNCGACGKTCPVMQPTCVGGQCTNAKPQVLLVAAPGFPCDLPDVQHKLLATGAFDKVDTFDAGQSTPSLAVLQKYEAVLVYGAGFADKVALGDHLGAYFDAGGRVVTAAMANSSNFLAGAFTAYVLLDPAGLRSTQDSMLGVIDEPQSPLVAGVVSLSAATAMRNVGRTINGAIPVAHWSDNSSTPLILRGTVKGRARVDVNLDPRSNDCNPGSWIGDGTTILKNALLYK